MPHLPVIFIGYKSIDSVVRYRNFTSRFANGYDSGRGEFLFRNFGTFLNKFNYLYLHFSQFLRFLVKNLSILWFFRSFGQSISIKISKNPKNPQHVWQLFGNFMITQIWSLDLEIGWISELGLQSNWSAKTSHAAQGSAFELFLLYRKHPLFLQGAQKVLELFAKANFSIKKHFNN